MATFKRTVILAAAYLASGYVGLAFPYFESTVTLIWPPTGIVLAALLCWGLRVWPGAAIGAFAVNLTTGVPVETVALITIGNTLSGVVGAALLNRFSHGPVLGGPRDVVMFLLLGVAASALVSSLNGAAAICLTLLPDWTGFFQIWWGWWVGDLMGVLLFAPPLLLLATRPWQGRPLRWHVELGLVALGAAAISILVHSVGALARQEFLLLLVSLPFALWGVVRFGLLGAAVVNGAVCLTAVSFLAAGHSLFIVDDAQLSLLRFYGFFCLIGGISLLLAGFAEITLAAEIALPNPQRAGRIRRMRTALAVGCGAAGFAVSIAAAATLPGPSSGPLAQSAWQPLGILLAGASLSAALSLYLMSLTRTEERITQLVEERSQLLQQARLEAEAALAQAQQANRAKTEFLAHMSHELRSPLNAILGYAELSLTDPHSRGMPEQTRRFIATIGESGRHLVGVIGDILDLAKIETGSMSLERVPLDLRRMAADAVSIMTPQAHAQGNSLAVEVAPELHDRVIGDPVRIRQVVLNFLSNAAKFTTGGSILLRIDRLEDHAARTRVRFAVADNGIGIPKARQCELFEAFTQADMSITRKYGGTGLGLAISRKLVTAMGGSVGVRSETGAGSEFWFDLSLDKAEPVSDGRADPADRATDAPKPVPPMSLLVVEDSEINRFLAERLLENAGHRVVTAVDGLEAVEAVRRQDFDAVLMDIRMPVLDGIEATRRIRLLADPVKRSVPIIALTANVSDQDIAEYHAVGMNDCCAKPMSMAALSQALTSANRRTGGGMATGSIDRGSTVSGVR